MRTRYLIVFMMLIISMGLFSLQIEEVNGLTTNDNIYISPTGDDSGDGSISKPFCTLSKAVSIVDDGGTIHVANGIYSGPLNRNITIKKNLRLINDITVPGEIKEARFDANQLDQIFIVGNHINLVLNGLVLVNGKVTVSNGYESGALFNDGGNVTIQNCRFENNQAVQKGGAIVNSGHLTITGSQFINNKALGSMAKGGAIYNMGGEITVISSKFISNEVGDVYGGNGGAISNSGTLIAENTSFEHNKVGTARGGGGAISNLNGLTNISGCSFSNNIAPTGAGAVYNLDTLSIVNSAFTNNMADQFGGAIVNSKTLTMTNVSASGNGANYGGFIDNGADEGSIITCTINGGTFTSNNAYINGGAFYNTNSSNVNIQDSKITENDAEDCGGGIFNKGTLNLRGALIQSNMAYMQSGGGIENQGTMNINDSSIINNKGCYGGGINNYRNMDLLNSTITGNTACINGGGISNNGNITIIGSRIAGNNVDVYNSSALGYGGGIGNNGNMTLNNSIITENTADVGGGIYNYKDDYSEGILRILDSFVYVNTAKRNGGGIQNNANAYATNLTIKENSPDNINGNPIFPLIENKNNLLNINFH
jgi:predicted outer membrane repeat protein